MNSHFQFSATTCTRTGFTLESSGRYGSSDCVVRQINTDSRATITQGTAQTTTSTRVECAHVGAWIASLFDAR